MPNLQLYFLSDQYYQDFPDKLLMRNKPAVEGVPHGRPCFLAFPDIKNPLINWFVPISSKCKKYRQTAQERARRHGRCNTICFGTVLGKEKAFLIQNMCPTTEKYMIPYMDRQNKPVRVSWGLAVEVQRNAADILALAKKGQSFIYPDIFKIYAELERQLREAAGA